ncbi:hypothetical protein [Streptomyces sp. NPDC054865]
MTEVVPLPNITPVLYLAISGLCELLMRKDRSFRVGDSRRTWVREFPDVLDSDEIGHSFTALIRIEWRRPDDSSGSTTGYGDVGRAVRGLAESLTSQRSVLRCEGTEQDINYELRRLLPWRADGSEIVRAHVTLRVDEHTRTSAERVAQLRREEVVDELARRQTAARIRFMQDEILRSPATARLYLMLEQNAPHGALPPGGDVDQLVRDVQQWHPQARWVVVAQLLHTFISKLESKDTGDLLRTLQALFLEYGQKELAQQLEPEQKQSAPGDPG